MHGTSQRLSQNQGQSPVEVFTYAEKVAKRAGMVCLDHKQHGLWLKFQPHLHRINCILCDTPTLLYLSKTIIWQTFSSYSFHSVQPLRSSCAVWCASWTVKCAVCDKPDTNLCSWLPSPILSVLRNHLPSSLRSHTVPPQPSWPHHGRKQVAEAGDCASHFSY